LVRVSEATAGAGWSGTVSVTYNGVAIATKTGKISGNIASISATAAKVVKNDGSARAGAFRFEAKDAAGNIVPLSTLALTSSSVANAITSASAGTASTADTKGYGTLTAGSGSAGSTSIVVQTTLASGTVVKSNAFTILVGGAAYTYSAKFDKAKYAQGDIATLTISFKDSKGNAANSGDSVTALALTQAAIDATISSPMLEKIGNVPGVSDLPNENGQIVYKFNVGGSGITFAAGKYNAVVTYPALTNGEAQTVGYEVTASGGGVSNSDILASIVKLITAINKQIAALQKLLLKK
jgi:hypothetical protein